MLFRSKAAVNIDQIQIEVPAEESGGQTPLEGNQGTESDESSDAQKDDPGSARK